MSNRKCRLLDLYCCQGGASAGYVAAGFDVVGVDSEPQPRYPFDFVQADALDYVLSHGRDFDVIHASPPCQPHSQNNNWGTTRPRADLLAPTRDALIFIGVPWVIENVPGAPMRTDLRLCGTAFGLPLKRHRLFESNIYLGLAPPCNHWSYTGMACPWRVRTGDTSQGKLDRKKGAFVSPAGNPNCEKGSLAEWLAAMRTPWMDRHGVTQAIPPDYSKFIGSHIIRHLATQ